ncbi:tRNA (adenosine(37)-N6)-dimethylallyltransferase MiaA [Pedobacter aquatilis]|uniref:tRNA (adenosine(37)-N6)-dimethylallyltransferase MiaA n=1 Tax=Pedobacter aquatilis TaxID=351343 RepID=UPI0025B54F86|nr:tRNA (adenosine(37)-N6)-dimethylallyltransferase MiaA [Pedobacter aquatilis]MDN3585336.1 tRNA (adenosine(37)-N6)-dimethylallyltransferase MiaA [Pedobacter aquatilis]
MEEKPLLIILGATASGKTKLAVQVAEALSGEIISADSRQIFKRMNIGTGKDLAEYSINNKVIPYHLIDILEPGERYHVDAFKNDFFEAFEKISSLGKLPILCGGTGMYIHSILQSQPYTAVPVNQTLRDELDLLSKDELVIKLGTCNDEYVSHVDKSSKKRLIRAIEIGEYLNHNTLEKKDFPKFNPLVFGLKSEVDITRSNILKRLDHRLKNGMIEEVEQLIKDGISMETLIFYGLEYKFIVMYLAGELTFDELQLKLGVAICQFAKRQNTFFRKMEKDGISINWLDAKLETSKLKQQILKMVSINKK